MYSKLHVFSIHKCTDTAQRIYKTTGKSALMSRYIKFHKYLSHFFQKVRKIVFKFNGLLISIEIPNHKPLHSCKTSNILQSTLIEIAQPKNTQKYTFA